MSGLESIQSELEWHCNETNNYHCKVETEIRESDNRKTLLVWPRTNKRGEHVKVSGWGSVIEFMASKTDGENGLVFRANPGELMLVDAGG